MGRLKNRAIKYLFTEYIYRAKLRNHSFTITFKEFVDTIKRPCHYCGSKPSAKTRSSVKAFTNGIDRVDPTKGYEANNIVAACVTCNRMKSDFTQDYFIQKVKKINEFFSNKVKDKGKGLENYLPRKFNRYHR